MAYLSKFVPGLTKSCVRLNVRPFRSNVQFVPRRFEGRCLHTETSDQNPYWKSATRGRGHLVVVDGVVISSSAFAIFTTVNRDNARQFAAKVSEPAAKTQTASTLPLDQVPSHVYNTSNENLRAAMEKLKILLGAENVSLQTGERIAHSSLTVT